MDYQMERKYNSELQSHSAECQSKLNDVAGHSLVAMEAYDKKTQIVNRLLSKVEDEERVLMTCLKRKKSLLQAELDSIGECRGVHQVRTMAIGEVVDQLNLEVRNVTSFIKGIKSPQSLTIPSMQDCLAAKQHILLKQYEAELSNRMERCGQTGTSLEKRLLGYVEQNESHLKRVQYVLTGMQKSRLSLRRDLHTQSSRLREAVNKLGSEVRNFEDKQVAKSGEIEHHVRVLEQGVKDRLQEMEAGIRKRFKDVEALAENVHSKTQDLSYNHSEMFGDLQAIKLEKERKRVKRRRSFMRMFSSS